MKKFREWEAEQELKSEAVWADKKRRGFHIPSYATGGSYIWCFKQTGIAVACHVKNEITGDELDLSDYENW